MARARCSLLAPSECGLGSTKVEVIRLADGRASLEAVCRNSGLNNWHGMALSANIYIMHVRTVLKDAFSVLSF